VSFANLPHNFASLNEQVSANDQHQQPETQKLLVVFWTQKAQDTMFLKLTILFLFIILYLEVASNPLSSVEPKPFSERLKTRRIFQTLDSRFSDDDFTIEGPKPEKVKLDDNGEVLPFDLDSRFTFDGEDNREENIDNSLEYGEYFQGDLELMPEQDDVFKSKITGNLDTRTGQLDEYYRWPKNRQGFVIVPYVIHEKSRYSELFLIFRGLL
jgi:hypothetical protein